ncbi:hypothetical protein SSPIM334S_07746 [Streptomyces spiroverticillatus]|uniref:hypothetical protein n=1 Tax=Streptomyces finlayi TaxID=67296 RepID=UPI0016795754|nr:hypothetical protein [Streptomyces finlayi]
MSDTYDTDGDLPEDDGVLDAQDTLITDRLDYDPLDSGIDPPDHWSPAESFGTTAEEARRGESLDQLLAEEEPDLPQPSGDEFGEEYADDLDLDPTDDP